MAPKMSKHVPRLTAGEFLELMDEVIYPEDNTTPARPLSTSRWRPALLTHPGGFERLLKRLLLSQAASRTSRVERRGLGPRFESVGGGRGGDERGGQNCKGGEADPCLNWTHETFHSL